MTSVHAHPPLFERVRSLPVERLLAVIGGACAAGFGLLVFLLRSVGGGGGGVFGGGVTGAVLTLAVALVFGALLAAWGMRSAHTPREWSITVGAFALVLLIFGGTAGAIGGVLGLVAAGIVFARELRTA